MHCPPIIRLKRVIFLSEKVPKKILEDIVNIYRVKKYFSLDGWKKMSDILQTVEEESFWECPTWRRTLDDKKPPNWL